MDKESNIILGSEAVRSGESPEEKKRININKISEGGNIMILILLFVLQK